jgi:hypothetical protein
MVVLPTVVVMVEPPEVMIETMGEVVIAELAPAPEVAVADALPPAPLPLVLGVTPGPV